MDFAFSEDQEMLRREARRYLAERYPGDGEWDPSSWQEIAKLGWTGISVPEAQGGAGLGFLEEAVLFEELGRACFPGPYFATVGLALPALSPEQQALVASGERTYSLALDGWRVPDAGLVDEVVELTDPALAEPIRCRALAALSLEAVGIAQRALELGVEHARTREQFGKPIGTYQAVSHKLADTYLETELARSLAYWAAWCVAEGDEQLAVAERGGQVLRRRRGRGRLRAVDPGARGDRLHLGARVAPLLQAGDEDPGRRRLRLVPPRAGRPRPVGLNEPAGRDERAGLRETVVGAPLEQGGSTSAGHPLIDVQRLRVTPGREGELPWTG